MITPVCFTYFQASRDVFRTKSNRIKFDCVRCCSIGSIIEPRESNSQQIRSILIDCRTQSSSIEFWLDFVRVDTQGSLKLLV